MGLLGALPPGAEHVAWFWALGVRGTVLCASVSPFYPSSAPGVPAGLPSASFPSDPPLWVLGWAGGRGGGKGGHPAVRLFTPFCSYLWGRSRCDHDVGTLRGTGRWGGLFVLALAPSHPVALSAMGAQGAKQLCTGGVAWFWAVGVQGTALCFFFYLPPGPPCSLPLLPGPRSQPLVAPALVPGAPAGLPVASFSPVPPLGFCGGVGGAEGGGGLLVPTATYRCLNAHKPYVMLCPSWPPNARPWHQINTEANT